MQEGGRGSGGGGMQERGVYNKRGRQADRNSGSEVLVIKVSLSQSDIIEGKYDIITATHTHRRTRTHTR